MLTLFARISFLLVLTIDVIGGIDGETMEKPKEMLEDKIIRKLERLRRTMPFGNSERNIPILDPLSVNMTNVNVDISNLRLSGILEHIKLFGLKYFYVDGLELHILPVGVDFDITFPALEIAGRYNMKGKFLKFLPIFGKGRFSVKFHQIKVKNKLKLSLREKFLKVLGLNSNFIIDGFIFKINGLYGSEIISKLFSEATTIVFPKLFKYIQMYVNDMLTMIGLDAIKSVIHEKTTKEIVQFFDSNDDGLLP